MANRKSAALTTADDTVDRRPCVPGLYRRVLPVVCRKEVTRSPRFVHHALRDEQDPQCVIEAAEITAQADQLAAERLAAGEPIECWWYDVKELPAPFDQLPPPLNKLGHDPAPRNFTVYADDRIDARNHFEGLRKLYYERARYSRTCDHSYFQSAFALAAEWGVG